MPRYVDTMLCEVVRVEANNKLSLLDLFGDSILVPRVPVVLPSLAIIQRWQPTPSEPPGAQFSVAFELRGPGLAPIRMPAQAVVVPGPPKPLINIIMQLQGLPVAEQGNYQLVTYFNDVLN
jgi:hypothetical protein